MSGIDSILQIEDHTYHLECQSSLDGRMVIRMFEYDFSIALELAQKKMKLLKSNFHNRAYCIFEITESVVFLITTRQL